MRHDNISKNMVPSVFGGGRETRSVSLPVVPIANYIEVHNNTLGLHNCVYLIIIVCTNISVCNMFNI